MPPFSDTKRAGEAEKGLSRERRANQSPKTGFMGAKGTVRGLISNMHKKHG
jgi:hypothetical protein